MALFDSPNMGPAIRTQRKALKEAKEARKTAMADVQTGIDTGSPYLQEATTVLDPITGQKQGVYDLYIDSLGANGPEGRARALEAFQTGPGYQFNLEQMQQGADRFHAGRGSWNSGNALDDLTRLQFGLANNEFGGWQNRLKGEDPTSLYGAKGDALTNLGNFFQTGYSNKANAGLQGAQLQQGAFNSLAAGLGQNASNQAAASNALPGILLQGGINAFGGYFSGGHGAPRGA